MNLKVKDRSIRFSFWFIIAAIGAVLLCTAGTAMIWPIIANLSLVSQLHESQAEHIDQAELLALVQAGEDEEAFELAFETGDEFFETVFNALDGVGANVGGGQRFTRIPRADLNGPGEWANHTPVRATGPNAEACNLCHDTPEDDGAGTAVSNNHRDPFHTASLGSIINRQAPHVFAPGAIQRLAEEMTTTLKQIRENARNAACATGFASKPLVAKGVSFGTISATRTSTSPCVVTFDTSGVLGVAADLIVRPFEWKGATTNIRAFNRGASHNELGMQPVETTGDGVDGDFDSIVDETTIGDQTALAVYLAAQPRPVTKLELNALGLLEESLTPAEITAINHGAQVFNNITCAACHVPQLKLDNKIFSEPSQHADYRDAVFPAGQDPIAEGVNPAFPVTFDLTKDQPDNVVFDTNGNVHTRLGSFPVDGMGKVVVSLYGDLKRHEMGPGLAESIDEAGTGPSNFLTENLWGVGSTAPYLHDGRATTITEAILEHGGDATVARTNFLALPLNDKKDLIAFLENLVLFKPAGQDVNPLVTGMALIDVSVNYKIVEDWGHGAIVSVTITNNATTPINGWTIKWNFTGNQHINGIWSGNFVQTGNAVTVTNTTSNSTIPANGGSINFGFNLSYTGTNQVPATFNVNGTAIP